MAKDMKDDAKNNTQVVDGKKVFNCVQCGECCHIRERDKNISKEDEEKYRQYMYARFGILYLARLSDITINVWPEEAETLKNLAKSKGVTLRIAPKRVIYDKKHHEVIILDYFIDHDICPFYDTGRRLCSVYAGRPIICRSYPLLTTKTLGKCKYKLDNPDYYGPEKPEAAKLERMIGMQKHLIKSIIEKGEIEIAPSLSGVELDSIFRTARYKELRLMDKI